MSCHHDEAVTSDGDDLNPILPALQPQVPVFTTLLTECHTETQRREPFDLCTMSPQCNKQTQSPLHTFLFWTGIIYSRRFLRLLRRVGGAWYGVAVGRVTLGERLDTRRGDRKLLGDLAVM
eukprot:GFYU01009570.1.p2 GENE.GFYU01009570.1~~GFYU01009570.1.p2  ORF type:complete len:121 (-),score=13.08 GFYU01009570.1:430-792(-)